MALKRLLWKKWLFIGQTEGETEQAYWNEKRKKHLAHEHNEGMVYGLEVVEASPPSLRVRVNAGRAIDTNGADPEVESIQELDCTSLVPGSGSVTVYVTLAFGEQEVEPYYVDEIAANQNKYEQDVATLAVGTTAPSDPTLELGRILLVAGATQITDAADPDNPGNNEIDLRYRKKATAVVMNLDDLADVSVAEAAAFNNMASPSSSNPIATISEVDSRVNPTKNEVQTARGSQSSLDARLDVSLEENGALKSGTVGGSQVAAGSLDDSHLSSSADVSQTKVADTADASEDDTFSGAPANLEDDLNEIRTKIKDLKGTTGWKDANTDTLEGVVGEVQAARGSVADVDTRLDASHNEDGTHRTDVDLGKEVADARGSKTSLDARLDVTLNEDGSLKSIPVSTAIPRLAGEPTLVFYPKDGSWTNTYRLHQFRGYLKGQYSGGAPPTIYVDFGRSHAQYPQDVSLGGLPGPGGSDNDPLSGTVGQFWYYVYLIGKADGTVALVYSQSGRSPWTQGPLLDNSNYDFPGNGWIYWKFIAALRNGQVSTWQIVPMRKIGNHVNYEQAQYMFSGSGGGTGVTQFSLGTRIPETSMRAEVMAEVSADNDGGSTLLVRPASVASANGETMMLQDMSSPPASPLSTYGVGSTGSGWTLGASTAYAGGGEGNADINTGWVDTDDWQRIDYQALTGGGGGRSWALWVKGYKEFTDFASGEVTFP